MSNAWQPQHNTVADTIALTLQAHGVTEVFGQSLPSAFFLAAERHGMTQISYRTENAGGAMADAYARVSNRVGVVGAQNGPAATLLVPPLAEALTVSIPLLALVQEVPTRSRDRNAFQEFDHRALFGGVAKSINTITDPQRAQEYVEAALRIATSGRPGPVVLLLPSDILLEEAPEVRTPLRRLTSFPLDRTRPDATGIEAAAAAIADARRPVVIAGGGVHLSGAVAELVALQEDFALPVATTNMGKGAVSELSPLSLGVVGSAMGEGSPQAWVAPLLRDADLVLLVGTRTNENGTDSWRLLPENATFIHIDVDGVEVGRNYASLPLVGDARSALADLHAALSGRTLSHLEAGREAVEERVARPAGRPAFPEVSDGAILPQQIAEVIDRLVSDDAILVADASYSTLWTTYFLTAKRAGQRFLTPRGLAGLGWGFPMALGAQVAAPGRQVVCLTGDGGFGHVWAELETAVRENLPVTVVVINNGILGFQRHAELVKFGAHTSAVDFVAVDHVGIAEAVGVRGSRVTELHELEPALAEALAHDGPALVEVIASPNSYPPITLWDAERAVLVTHEKKEGS
jgi:acetolactate synthase-1/2/3 large subunit